MDPVTLRIVLGIASIVLLAMIVMRRRGRQAGSSRSPRPASTWSAAGSSVRFGE